MPKCSGTFATNRGLRCHLARSTSRRRPLPVRFGDPSRKGYRRRATNSTRRIIVASVACISSMPARTSSGSSPLSAANSSTASSSSASSSLLPVTPQGRVVVGHNVESGLHEQRSVVGRPGVDDRRAASGSPRSSSRCAHRGARRGRPPTRHRACSARTAGRRCSSPHRQRRRRSAGGRRRRADTRPRAQPQRVCSCRAGGQRTLGDVDTRQHARPCGCHPEARTAASAADVSEASPGRTSSASAIRLSSERLV